MSPPPRRLPGVFCAALFFCYAWSFSTRTQVVRRSALAVNQQQPRYQGILSMAAAKHVQSGDESSAVDPHLMKSVVEAKTSKEMDETLRNAFVHVSPPDLSSEEKIQFIHLNDTAIQDTLRTFPRFSMEVLAAALRRLALISAKEVRQQHLSSDGAYPNHDLLTSLLENIGHQMVLAQRHHGILGVYPLADILQALAILSSADVYMEDSQEQEILILVDQLTEIVVEMLTRHEVVQLRKLGPIRLLQCLQAMTKLELVETPLHFRIYEELLKPNASSRIPPRFLAHGLDTFATLASIRHEDENESIDEVVEESNKPAEITLLARAFMRRFRKQHVREEASVQDLCRALMAADELWHNGGLKDLEDEAAMFGFSSLRQILSMKHEKDVPISPGQMATMMAAWATLTNKQKEDTVIEDLLQICETDRLIEKASLQELERILSSIQQLRIMEHEHIMAVAGERLLHLTKSSRVSPRSFSSILRCPILLHRRKSRVMEPYVQACEIACLDESFVAKCKTAEIANFLWFASIVQWRNDDALKNLGYRLEEPQLSENCNPRIASRILATFTAILSLPETGKVRTGDTEQMQELTTKIFHCYGGHLLTRKLSAVEVSSALTAYAKASFYQDMGIFDHLLSLMADMSLSDNTPTVRQMTQCLWSCGKMSVYESHAVDSVSDEGESDIVEAPYMESARAIAASLAKRSNELSRVDVTQCIWALGKLRVSNWDTVSQFVERAEDYVSDMNAVEISNVLWGLSRTGYDYRNDGVLVDRLTNQLITGDVHISPKEAAMSLYALGRMRVANQEVFTLLSDVMIDNIRETSAQGIANTLWAFRNVNLRPPGDLLNLWTIQKLGLVTVKKSDFNR